MFTARLACYKFSRMRVKLHFYPNIRPNSYCYIKEEYKTVSDLEKQIKTVFKINNTTLIINNYHLPSSADIGIIQQDDIVFVIPYSELCLNNKAGKMMQKPIKKTSRKRKKEQDDITHGIKYKKQKLGIFSSNKLKATSCSSGGKTPCKEEAQYCSNNNLNEESLNISPNTLLCHGQELLHHINSININKITAEINQIGNVKSTHSEYIIDFTYNSSSERTVCTDSLYIDNDKNFGFEGIVENSRQYITNESNEKVAKDDKLLYINTNPNYSKKTAEQTNLSSNQVNLSLNKNYPDTSSSKSSSAGLLCDGYNDLEGESIIKRRRRRNCKQGMKKIDVSTPVAPHQAIYEKTSIREKSFIQCFVQNDKQKHNACLAHSTVPWIDRYQLVQVIEAYKLLRRYQTTLNIPQIVNDQMPNIIPEFYTPELLAMTKASSVTQCKECYEKILKQSYNLQATSSSSSFVLKNAIDNNVPSSSPSQPLTVEIIDKLLQMTTMFPASGDVIVFKIFKLGPENLPIISNYIVGLVEGFNHHSYQTDLIIQGGLSEFQTSIKNEQPKEDVAPDIKQILDWRKLISPRLVSPG